MGKPLDIYVLAERQGESNSVVNAYKVTIVVNLPLYDFVRSIDILLQDYEIQAIESLKEKLNAKDLGFKLHFKVE